MPERIVAGALPTSVPEFIHIRAQNNLDIQLESTPDLKSMAMRWAYVVRNRVRWAEDKEALDNVRKSATEDLAAMGGKLGPFREFGTQERLKTQRCGPGPRR